MNTITYIEIPAPDLSKAIAFYSAIFDWEIQVIAENSYAYFIIEDKKSGGGFDASLKPSAEKTGCQVVVDVTNIKETLSLIRKAGGAVIMDKTEIEGGHRFYAVFKDPNGNFMQIHSRS